MLRSNKVEETFMCSQTLVWQPPDLLDQCLRPEFIIIIITIIIIIIINILT